MASVCYTHNYSIPKNDEDRLKKLYRFGILDTPHEISYDRLAILASSIFKTSGSWISFIDRERVWYKSNTTRINQKESLRQESICALAMHNEEPTVYYDTYHIPELNEHPLVYGEAGIRFYAAVPIRTFEGYNIGMLAVVDYEPKEHVSEEQIEMLRQLADVVVDQLEQRLAVKNAHLILDDHMEKTIHNLKSPISAIKALSEEIQRTVDDREAVAEMSMLIKDAATSLIEGLTNLKEISKIENGNIQINLQPLNLEEVLTEVVNNFERSARDKRQSIILNINSNREIKADRLRIREVFDNLISNAIKYSYYNSCITINVLDNQNKVRIEFCDQGQGLMESDKEKLFTKFARLSAVPTGRETSTGLGLSIVKMLVDLHHGKIWAESEGRDKGSKFILEFPARIILKRN